VSSPPSPPGRKPEWLHIRLATTPSYTFLKRLVREEGLHTVCEEARCPNLQECWGRHRTASFMILGDTCTRRCRFCAVKTGLPREVDRREPERVAQAVKRMSLEHAHITMVNRDDLADGGASLLAATVRAVRRENPGCSIEVLASDFLGDPQAIRLVVASRPDILSHNLETVRRLTPLVRSRSDYDRSLAFLRLARESDPALVTKSSLMLGLGESREEVVQAMRDLRAVGTDMLNLGQYLQPGRTQLPVARYWTPEEFAGLRAQAFRLGFLHCEAGPLVRSSYHAGQQFRELQDLRGPAAGA
jgi:lipoic acid synthetase